LKKYLGLVINVKLKNMTNTNKEPIFELSPKEKYFHDHYENAYIDIDKRQLEKKLLELEEELRKEMEKIENKDFLPGHYLLAVFNHERLNILVNKKDTYVQRQIFKSGKNWEELSFEEINKIADSYPNNKELYALFDQTIDMYRKVTAKYWQLSKFSNTTKASILLADLLHTKSFIVEDEDERKSLQKESEDIYENSIRDPNIPYGIKAEYLLTQVMRKVAEKYSSPQELKFEHGLPREDEGSEKIDLKFSVANRGYNIQLLTISENEYTEEYNQALKEEKRKVVPSSTNIIVITKEALNSAYKNLHRRSTNKLLMQISNDLFTLPTVARDFREKILPPVSKKEKEEIMLTKKIFKDILRFRY